MTGAEVAGAAADGLDSHAAAPAIPDPGWVVVGDITAIAPAWVSALGELQEVVRSKTADAGTYTYRYAELGDITSHARAVLAGHDLAVWQVATIEDHEIAVRNTVMHTSGVHLVFDPFRLPVGTTAQHAGSAATYARRYSLMAILGLATEDDDGAAAATRPPPAPSKLSVENVDRFLAAAHEANLTVTEIGEVVLVATGGRTREPAQVWVTEVAALRKALAAPRDDVAWVAAARADELDQREDAEQRRIESEFDPDPEAD